MHTLLSTGDFFIVDGSGETKDVSSSFCPGLYNQEYKICSQFRNIVFKLINYSLSLNKRNYDHDSVHASLFG